MEDLVDREVLVSNESGQEFLNNLFAEIKIENECRRPKITLLSQLAGLADYLEAEDRMDDWAQISILFNEVLWYFTDDQ